MDEIKDKLTNPSKETMQDKRGHFWCYLILQPEQRKSELCR